MYTELFVVGHGLYLLDVYKCTVLAHTHQMDVKNPVATKANCWVTCDLLYFNTLQRLQPSSNQVVLMRLCERKYLSVLSGSSSLYLTFKKGNAFF